MKTYLVGGAIRDRLLGFQPKERDWVVVGSSPQEMKSQGFRQVGKDFPVFIHPKTGEEYALARTERKSGHGYSGFKFDTNSNVTLEQDLERRDLTINAIAEDEHGTLIDPFDGQKDIKNKKLRHVSDAFSEDPLRVLRLARFKVRFDDFEIVPETLDKVTEIIESSELDHLTGERVWLEMYKSDNPWLFRKELTHLGADNVLYIDSKKSDGIYLSPNMNNKLHMISCFIHEEVSNIDEFCLKLKIPNEYKDLANLLNQSKASIEEYEPVTDSYQQLIDIVKKLDIRKKDRLKNFFEVCTNNGNKDKVGFFQSFIEKLNQFRLEEEDRKKPNDEIKKVIEHSHSILAQDHIREYLDNK